MLVANWTPSAFSGVAALLGTVTVSVFQALVLRLPIGCQLLAQL